MNTFRKIAPWITRLTLILPTALLVKIGIQNTLHPTTVAGDRGIVFVSGMGMTLARIGFGAFPLACGLFLLACMLSERRLLTALAFVATLDSVILAIRITGMFVDSSIQENFPLVRTEAVLLVLTGAGVFIEWARKQGASLRLQEGASHSLHDHRRRI